jgi:hypothetical protein
MKRDNHNETGLADVIATLEALEARDPDVVSRIAEMLLSWSVCRTRNGQNL